MFFENLENRRMFAVTVKTALPPPQLPSNIAPAPVIGADSVASQANSPNLINTAQDPAKLAGSVTLANGLSIALNPAQRPAAAEFATGLQSLLGDLFGDSFLKSLAGSSSQSTAQLRDLAGSANPGQGALLDLVGIDLAQMRSIYEQANGDRTSQAAEGVIDFLASLWDKLTGSGTDTQPPPKETDADNTEAEVPDPPIEPIHYDPDDLDEVDCAILDKAKIYEHFCVRKGRNNEGTPDPNSDQVSLTPQQLNAINQLWALASKYVTNPPRALDQGTGLISLPPDESGSIIKPDRNQLPGPDALRSGKLAPYINPGSGDDGSGVVIGEGTGTPRVVATVKCPLLPEGVGTLPGGATPRSAPGTGTAPSTPSSPPSAADGSANAK